MLSNEQGDGGQMAWWRGTTSPGRGGKNLDRRDSLNRCVADAVRDLGSVSLI